MARKGKAHFVSVGGDVEIGALAAAFANGDSFTVVDPCGEESIVSLGRSRYVPWLHCGSRTETAARHLVSCFAGAADNTSDGKLLRSAMNLCLDGPTGHWPAGHTGGMGALADLCRYSSRNASSRSFLDLDTWCRHQGKAERVGWDLLRRDSGPPSACFCHRRGGMA